MHLRRVIPVALALAVAALLLPVSPPAAAQPAPEDDPALLRELAERLLIRAGTLTPIVTSDGGTGTPPTQTPQIFVGRLPPDLGFIVPIPPGSRLLGSAESTTSGPRQFQIVFDMPGTVPQIHASFETLLAAEGWTAAPDILPGLDLDLATLLGGFVSPAFADFLDRPDSTPRPEPRNRTFCPPAGSPRNALTVDVLGSVPLGRDVRIYGGALAFRCEPNPASAPLAGLAGRVSLPRLIVPPDLRILAVGRGGPSVLDGAVSSEATVRTARTITDLEAYFAVPLAAAGWTRREGVAETLLAWSLWSIPDRPGWTAFLTITAQPGADIRILRLEARPDAPAPRRLP